MTFDFSFTKEEHYQFLLKGKKRNLWIWYSLYTVLYIFFVYFLIEKSPLTVALIYIVSIIVLYFIFKTFNILISKLLLRTNEVKYHSYGKYQINLNDKKIIAKVNGQKYEYRWDQIQKIKIKKDAIYIEPRKEKIMLFLPKKCIGETLYNEIKDYLKDIIIN